MDKAEYIHVDRVSKTFETPLTSVVALNQITFMVARNEFVSIIGPSGCGKSTLLRLVAGLVFPSEGRITVGGRAPEESRRSREYGFVFQDPVMLPWRSVRDNVELALEVMEVEKAVRRQTAAEFIHLVGLAGFEEMRPGQLSGGMRQRAALARALTMKPQLLLMDEPFGALDEITRAQMNAELLNILAQQDLTVLLVTHSIEEAVFLSDRVVVLTPRPAEIREILEIDLPRPRHRSLKKSNLFFEYVSALRNALEFEQKPAAARM
ncbi:MAG TPA: sulfonate ABC transporter ATP-binding protein [Chloroflexi bacterium]|nr:sulfonate ABC transporter ATP-binding protein [Chloroflexota bacterium]